MSTIIEYIWARKVLDSRGNWTIEVDVCTEEDGFGNAAAPSGASTGEHEVVSFPEGDVNMSLIELEEVIIPELIGWDSANQDLIDTLLKEIDGTDNFSNIGGNTATAISLACAKAAASSHRLSLYQYLSGSMATYHLPFPLGNIIGGGAHAPGTDIQEFQAIPVGANDIESALKANILVHRKVKERLKKAGKLCGRGDEGAWVADLKNEKALALLAGACDEVTGDSGVEVRPCLDVAASELWDEKKERYIYRKDKKELTREEQIEYIQMLIDEYKLYYVEDPLEQNDFDGFAELKKSALICGDDLYTTNVERIKEGIKKNSTNAVLIKINQIGTLTDTYCAIKTAKDSKQAPVISHRSGETTDESIAHLAVGFGCPIIKTGTIGGERISKLNELLRIAEELGPDRAKMAKLPL
ncbi:MAG: phosphopyruvate hydratase [Candidatus Hydrothermarchaeales archaeon]